MENVRSQNQKNENPGSAMSLYAEKNREDSAPRRGLQPRVGVMFILRDVLILLKHVRIEFDW